LWYDASTVPEPPSDPPPDPEGTVQALTVRPLRRVVAALCLSLPLAVPVGPVEAARPPARPPAGKGTGKAAPKRTGTTVVVRSTTRGARIYVDGQPVGTVPQEAPIPVSPGMHTIKVTKPGHSDYLDTFQVKRGEEHVLEIDLLALAGVLIVDSTAPGAIVAVDQRQIGEVPFEGEISPGTRSLEVRAPGYSTFRQSLEVVAGETYTFDAHLIALAPGSEFGEAATPWYGHWWLWAGAAVLVAGGVTAGILLTREEAQETPRNQLPFEWLDAR
jgi:hypothetical protein